MDLSEVNIKMCEKATEVQAAWRPTGGDWLVFDYRGTTAAHREFEKRIWGDDDAVWKRVEILCYQPSESKDWWISSSGQQSLVKSSQDLTKEHAIWLPRQDQLQEMVPNDLLFTVRNFAKFTEAVMHELGAYVDTEGEFIDFTSMEQLWLAFVMKENHGKVWNGTDWVKEVL